MEIKIFQPSEHKIKALVYGPSGAGKTYFAGTAKNAVFASSENGLLSIAHTMPKAATITSLRDLIDLYRFLSEQEHDYETVVIDSITEINEIIKTELEKKNGRSMQLQDWGDLAKQLRSILRSFHSLPVHVIFIAQEQNIVDDQAIHKIVPSLNGKAATEIAYFMDVVAYAGIDKHGIHYITTAPNAKLLTKSRIAQLTDNLSMDFSEWVDRLSNFTPVKPEKLKPVKKEVATKTESPKEPKTDSAFVKSSDRPIYLELIGELKEGGADTPQKALKFLREIMGADIKGLSEINEQMAQTLLIELLKK